VTQWAVNYNEKENIKMDYRAEISRTNLSAFIFLIDAVMGV